MVHTREHILFIYINNMVTGHKLNETMHQGRSHAPKLPSALLGAPTATTVSTPPVGVHRRREAAADGMSHHRLCFQSVTQS